MAKFSEVLTIINGKNQSKVENPNGRYPIYGSGGIIGYANDYICEPQTVIIGRKGNINKPIFVETPFWNVDTAFGLNAKKDILIPKYLYYFCEHFDFEKLNTTVTIPSLTKVNLLNIEIEVPSIESQEKIVACLDKISNLIFLCKQQLEKLDELVKARFFEMFGDPMTNSNGYELKTYGELFELNAGGTPSKQKTEYWNDGTISWIGSNMCQNSVIYENDGNYITEEGLNHSSARMFPVDTVLIALVGATIGKTALLKFETTTNQNVLGVRGIKDIGYTPEFIFYYTQGLYQKFLNIGDGGFAMASKGFISELPVPIVDLEFQEQFTAFVEQTDKLKFDIKQSLEKLETLKKSLMQQYFG